MLGKPTSEKIAQDIFDLPRVLGKMLKQAVVWSMKKHLEMDIVHNGWTVRGFDAKVVYDNILGVQENLDNLNIVLDTIEEVENFIDDTITNIEIERDQEIRDN